MLLEKNTVEDAGRIETLKELVIALQEFDNIKEFLDYVGLIIDNTKNVAKDFVTISTIHSAKGLEYKIVFIPGFENDLFPHPRSIEEHGQTGIEEERRLFYVAMTRAKNEVYITMCRRRNLYNQSWQNVSPSRFLEHLPKDNVKII